MPALRLINCCPPDHAAAALLDCCGSTAWANAMVSERPFQSTSALHAAADAQMDRLERDDWLQAFAAHPRIGDSADRGSSAGARSWSSNEQSGMHRASDDLRDRMARGNDAYYQRFGFVFLICATGRSAEEMLAELEARIDNDPDEELAIAAEEQRLITHLRLDKLLADN